MHNSRRWITLPILSLLALSLAGTLGVLNSGRTVAAATTGSTYYPLTPVRILDTRITHQTLGTNQSLNLQVAGVDGVPSNASAVVVNLTVTDTTSPSFLTAYPTGGSLPLVSNLNWTGGQTIANLATIPVGSGGEITIYNDQGQADVVVDLQGYFLAGSTGSYYVPLSPARITDTRANSGEPNAGKTLSSGSTLTVQVAGMRGIPTSNVAAAVLNVTVTDTNANSYLSVYPANVANPGTSTLNWGGGQTIANRVIVPLSPAGQIDAYNAWGNADVVIDVTGYFVTTATGTAAAALYYPVSPTRVLDTRVVGNTMSTQSSLGIQLAGVGPVSGAATAVMANLTATNTSNPSYFSLSETSGAPSTSDLNWLSGVTVANLDLTALNSSGVSYLFNDTGSADAIIDVFGYFQPVAPSPTAPAGACTSNTLSSPSSDQTPTSVNVSVQASCPSGTTPYYTYWYRTPGSGELTLAQGATTSSSFAYNTSSWAPGSYQLVAWVSTVAGIYQEEMASGTVSVTVGPCSGVNVSTTPNPGVVSTPVQITASASCPPGQTVSYVYWARNNNVTSNWTDISGWTTSSTWLASTEGWSSGNYSFLVWATNGSQSSPQVQGISNDALNGSGAFIVSGVTYSSQIYGMNCEETSLQMALTHEGITIAGNNSTTQNDILAAEGVNTSVPGIGPGYPSANPMSNFIGPPNGGESSSYEPGAYYGAIVKAANHFGGDVLAYGEGISPTQAYRYVEENHPVVVWVTFDFQHYNASWYTDWAGQSIPWAGPHEHSVLVVGVGNGSVLIDNPWPSGTYGAEYWGQNVWVPMSVFESVYSTYNDMAVVLN